MKRSYYSRDFVTFRGESHDQVFGEISKNDHYHTTLDTQKRAWSKQIEVLQKLNLDIDRILFEYSIPRMGRRVDNVLFYQGVVYLLEFKVGSDKYEAANLQQVEGYALDLKYFQEGSRDRLLVPILVSTNAQDYENKIELDEEYNYCKPLRANSTNLQDVIVRVSQEFHENHNLDPLEWENSKYSPTPTIIEASQALYGKHTVNEITRSDADGNAFVHTSECVKKIIEESKTKSKKNLIFVTGVPGSGKTLVGLDVASKYQDTDSNERAVYICGTYTLIQIIQEALVRNYVENAEKEGKKRDSKTGKKITKTFVRKEKIEALFQFLPKYREEIVTHSPDPEERIVIFDEAQRMWNKEKFDSEIQQKLHVEPMGKSETDVLIEHMDKHDGWAVIICLIGGGQEIHEGEDGVSEWVKSIKNKFPHWGIHLPTEFISSKYLGNAAVEESLDGVDKNFKDELHLKTATRSFRAKYFSKFVNHLLDKETSEARRLMEEFNKSKDTEKFHLLITRDLQTAKNWVKKKSRVNQRYGLFMNTKGLRLQAEGLVNRGQQGFDAIAWWLDPKEYVDSSLALEIPCTEFFAQGLEVDWAIFAWDACFRPNNSDWDYMKFVRKEWRNIEKEVDRKYLKNSFRVLLTRARQGMIIFVPKGDPNDKTRLPEFYDGIYNYLKEIGIEDAD